MNRRRAIATLVWSLGAVCLALLYLSTLSERVEAQAAASDIELRSDWFSGDTDETRSVAWGDVDGDGDLDLAVGNDAGANKVYLNEDGVLQTAAGEPWTPAEDDRTESVAWGDVDGDGDLDLAVGNTFGPNRVYLNQGGVLEASANWQSDDEEATYSVAWGDLNGDGSLDLAVGNGDFGSVDSTANKVYLNIGGMLETTASWQSDEEDDTASVAWGDVDGDGDLDLVAGNDGYWGDQPDKVYLNVDGMLETTASWQSDPEGSTSVAWADVDGDGDPDLAAENRYGINRLYLNQGGALQTSASWQSTDRGSGNVAWGDVDGDGDLDLAAGSTVFRNDGGMLQTSASWQSNDGGGGSVAWGDVDGDGDLDLAAGVAFGPNRVFLNQSGVLQTATDSPWTSGSTEAAYSVAWGDVDGDGDLDLAVGHRGYVNTVHLNQGGILQTASDNPWTSGDFDDTWSVAWGDVDGNGYIDLVSGNALGDVGTSPDKVYLNQGGVLQTAANNPWTWGDDDSTASMAWGDVDGDGDLDLAARNLRGPNKVYLNQDGVLQTDADNPWTSGDDDETRSVAWGDVDGDGDLDLAAGNRYTQNKVYLNQNGVLQTAADNPWTSGDYDATWSVAWGDVDGDGDLDLAAGNRSGPNKVYLNEGGLPRTAADNPWTSGDTDSTTSVAWGDVDGDGDLDLVAGNGGPNKVYLNQNGVLQTAADGPWTSGDDDDTWSVAWGDVNGDGAPDLAAANIDTPSKVYLNQRPADAIEASGRAAAVSIDLESEPVATFNQTTTMLAPADFYAVPAIREDGTIPIYYTLYHPRSEPVREVRAYYSLNGGGQWLPAVPTPGTVTTNLATAPGAARRNTHLFEWDVFGSGLFGQSDNVVFRIEALPRLTSGPNEVPGPFQRPFVAAQTFPFRVRGNQIRVYTDTIASGNELPGALVYRIPAGQESGDHYADLSGRPYRTNSQGFLQGSGELKENDRVVALWPVPTPPITVTDNFSLYYTSAAPTATGLAADEVAGQSGIQSLVVRPGNKLVVLNLDVSLEWDARHDTGYLEQLAYDLRRASEILFDLSNGQVALGRVRVFQNRERWLEADVVIYARNDLRPNANLGGIVERPLSDTLKSGEVVPLAMLPGQVRMGATWNRYGNASGNIGEDWPRALAHEIGHYAFFLLDNYLGVEDGLMVETDCAGSAMTDAYREEYSEFLADTERNANGYLWEGECGDTLAETFTGRSDWQTIREFYPFLEDTRIPSTDIGPLAQPLNLTRVERVRPATPDTTLTDPLLNLTLGGTAFDLPRGSAQGYVLKTQGTAALTDDVVLPVGTPNGPLLLARGATPGDRLCVFGQAEPATMVTGCLDNMTPLATTLNLEPVPGWQPEITVNAVNSTTLSVKVTQALESGQALHVQVLPDYRPTDAVQALTGQMTAAGENSYERTFEFPLTVFQGHVRVWVPDSDLVREAITSFYLSLGWNGNQFRAFGGNAFMHWDGNQFRAFGGNQFRAFGGNQFRAFGANMNSWSAPTSSADGQVILFDTDNVLAGNVASVLQGLDAPPNLDEYPYLTPVGRAYRYQTAEPVSSPLVIQFLYLQRELPFIQEKELRIYYSPDEGQRWLRIEQTEVDAFRNLASARMRGPGIYALMATIGTPPLQQGWNLWAYPQTDERPVPTALSSIAGDYTSVYHFKQERAPQWLLHDQTVRPAFLWLVNDLRTLQPQQVYWIYARRPTIPYIGVPERSAAPDSPADVPLPPATFYGWVEPAASFSPQAGDPVTALIDGQVCGVGTVVEDSGRGAQPLQTRLVYKVRVRADSGDGCGVGGRAITFQVAGQTMPNGHPWTNSQACYLPLGLPMDETSGCLATEKLLLPIAPRAPGR